MIEIIRNSILITGLVVIMMMMIESLNIESKGLFFKGLRKTKVGQVVIASLLGSIPGCMGGFATVSLYTHRMFSFGALVAMMIASSGDEAFVMLAMIPEQALIIFAVLFVLAIAVGIITDKIYDKVHAKKCALHDHEECGVQTDCDGFEIHEHENHEGHDHSGHVHTEACEHHAHADHDHGHTIDLLSEDWMNVLFAGLSVIMLVVLIFAKDHFVEEHLWNHIIKKHLPSIFAWTFGVLLVLGIIMHFVNIDNWISDNTALMILLATLIGIIPESGPHMIFVTLFAAGVVPFPVLLASSISQDGHAGIPLLAESKKSFAQAKLINCFVALAAGFAAMLIM